MICGTELKMFSKLVCTQNYPETFNVTGKYSCHLNFIARHRDEIEEQIFTETVQVIKGAAYA